MATIELARGDRREHESIELRGGYIFAYAVEDDDYFADLERIYPVNNVVEIDPDEGVIKGAPPAGDGIMLVPE